MTTTGEDYGIDDCPVHKAFWPLYVIMLFGHVVCVVALTGFCMWRLHSIDMMFEAKLQLHNQQVLDRLEDLAK